MQIEYGFSLDISPHVLDAEGTVIYQLDAVVVYRGNAHKGHYYTFAKRDGTWFLYNDDCVRKVSLA